MLSKLAAINVSRFFFWSGPKIKTTTKSFSIICIDDVNTFCRILFIQADFWKTYSRPHKFFLGLWALRFYLFFWDILNIFETFCLCSNFNRSAYRPKIISIENFRKFEKCWRIEAITKLPFSPVSAYFCCA